jgi:hypothetical protein
MVIAPTFASYMSRIPEGSGAREVAPCLPLPAFVL